MPRISGALDIVQVNDPATPVAGRQYLYFKSDGSLYSKDSGGAVRQIGSGSGGGRTVVPITAATTAANNGIYLASGTFTVTVPVTAGTFVTVKNTGTGTITVAPVSGQIEGAATASVPPSASIDVAADGTNLWVI